MGPRIKEFFRRAKRKEWPMPVIVVSPRSGTTLLRFMLDAHPEVAIPPETGFLVLAHGFSGGGNELRREFFEAVTSFPPEAPAWKDFGMPEEQFWAALLEISPFSVAEGYRAFYRTYAARFGKRRWGDKTPLYCMHLEAIGGVLPEAHFIHIIRDGRDVALSLRQMWFSPGKDIEAQAEHWSRSVSTARQQGARCRRYLEVRFEDLIRDSPGVLKMVCEFIGVRYAAEMLEYYGRTPERLTEHRDRRRPDGSLVVSHAGRMQQQALTMQPPQASRVHAWKQAMSEEEQGRFEAIAGRLLAELGYEVRRPEKT
jgi:hypothetical protein